MRRVFAQHTKLMDYYRSHDCGGGTVTYEQFRNGLRQLGIRIPITEFKRIIALLRSCAVELCHTYTHTPTPQCRLTHRLHGGVCVS